MEMASLGIPDLEDRDHCIQTLSLSDIRNKVEDLKMSLLTTNDNLFTGFGIKDIKCGGNHTLVLLENGVLLGAGDLKELSNNSCNVADGWIILNHEIYKKVKEEHIGFDFNNYHISSVSSCWDSSFVTLKSRNDSLYTFVLSFGNQSKGELGRKQEARNFTIFEALNVKDIQLHACLYTNVMQVAYNNGDTEIYGWGSNSKGQLLKIETKADKQLETPKLLHTFVQNQQIECHIGKDFLVICDYKNDNVVTTGNKKIVDSFNATSISLADVDHVDTMWSSVHYNKNGVILGFGNDQLGQLCMNNKTLPSARFLKCGSEHMIYVSKKEPHIVKSWGWGEHGNCGAFTGDREVNKQLVFYEPNKIYETKREEEIVDIYGGCATTFILIS